MNSDDSARRAAAVRELFAPPALAGGGEAKLLGLLDRLRERLGSLAYHHSEAMQVVEGRTTLHVFAKSAATGQWHDIQFLLTPEPPHRMRELAFLAAVAEPVYLPNGAITNEATLAWLAGYANKLAAEDDLAGGLLIAEGDRVIFERSFGFADSARRHRITSDTRFDMASGGKMFTALVLAGLAEQGRLRLGDTLVRHLPALREHAFARRVTLAQLLSHTSGIAEFWNEEYERRWHEIRTLDQYLPFVLAAGTNASPGERFEYSNSNYILAGLVIEAVTRKPYERAVEDAILGPLGMKRTRLDPFDDRDSMQARRLAGKPREWKPARHGLRGSSAGGWLTTFDDMLRYSRGLVKGRIVSDSMLAVMTSNRTGGGGQAYGYGFQPLVSSGVRSFGHGGIASGVNFEYRYFPDSDLTLVAFSNQDNGAYDDLRRNATRLITGER